MMVIVIGPMMESQNSRGRMMTWAKMKPLGWRKPTGGRSSNHQLETTCHTAGQSR